MKTAKAKTARTKPSRKASASSSETPKKKAAKKNRFQDPADYFATFIQNMSNKFRDSKHWPRALRRATKDAGGSVSHPNSDNTRFQAPRGPQ